MTEQGIGAMSELSGDEYDKAVAEVMLALIRVTKVRGTEDQQDGILTYSILSQLVAMMAMMMSGHDPKEWVYTFSKHVVEMLDEMPAPIGDQ